MTQQLIVVIQETCSQWADINKRVGMLLNLHDTCGLRASLLRSFISVCRPSWTARRRALQRAHVKNLQLERQKCCKGATPRKSLYLILTVVSWDHLIRFLFSMASSRYYEDKDAQIQPGKMSDDLRKALNLAENDIPIWIYRMRAIGYPPGWLRKAIVDTSDIFDTDSPSEDSDHEEERSGSGVKRKGGPDRDEIKYDPNKLIEYPGFNTSPPPNTHDYHYYYNMPPMLPHQQLDFAKQTMSRPAESTPTTNKRSRASTESGAANQSSISLDTSAVRDKSEDQARGSGSNEEDTPASPDPESSNGGVEDAIETSSTNLKLDDSTAAVNVSSTSDIQQANTSNRSSSLVKNRSSISLNSSLNGEIKLVSKGSPMPEKVKRCDLEKFSQGVVGELLYFQNIPGSTGKFESIRGLLNTMRRSKSETDTSFACSTKSATKDEE